MGVKNKNKKEVKGSNLIAAAVANFEAMLREHIAEALAFLDESEDKKTTINCATTFDLSESEPQVESKMRFSQSVTDKRTSVLDDPNQGTFTTLLQPPATKGDEEGTKPAKVKKKNAKAKKGEEPKAPEGGEPPAQA